MEVPSFFVNTGLGRGVGHPDGEDRKRLLINYQYMCISSAFISM